MAVVKVVELISRAQTILSDAGATRYPLIELQMWINDAYREIVILKPSANTIVGSFTCAAGTKQSLTSSFPNALMLIDITRNVAATSSKRAVRKIDVTILDEMRPGWHGETQSVDIEHFVFDDRAPTVFWTYPPATSAAQVELLYSEAPAPHALTEAQLGNPSTAEVIKLDDAYANAILDYVLYRAFLKDVDFAGNIERATVHYQAMANSIGVRIKNDMTQSPSGRK